MILPEPCSPQLQLWELSGFAVEPCMEFLAAFTLARKQLAELGRIDRQINVVWRLSWLPALWC